MNKKNKIIGLCVIILSLATVLCINFLENKQIIDPGIIQHFQLNNQTINYLSHKSEIIAWLENEEKAVWSELEKSLNLSYSKCKKLQKLNRAAYQEDLEIVKNKYISPKNLSCETISCIESIMKDFNIDPTQLPIVGCNHGSAAAATDEFILVDEEMFNELDLKAKKFVVGHELTHFLHQDHSTNFIVREFAKKCNLSEDGQFNPVNRLFQFQELRADIVSALKGEDYAHGTIHFFNSHIEKQGPESGPPCHPTSSLRLNLGTKIAAIHAQSILT